MICFGQRQSLIGKVKRTIDAGYLLGFGFEMIYLCIFAKE